MKTLAHGLIALCAFTLAASASAHSSIGFTLDCTLLLTTEEIDGDREFKTLAAGKSHGGEEREFEFGSYKVLVVADGKWSGLSWWKGEQLVAESLTVTSEANNSKVLIMYNPKNRDEQVSLSCDATE